MTQREDSSWDDVVRALEGTPAPRCVVRLSNGGLRRETIGEWLESYQDPAAYERNCQLFWDAREADRERLIDDVRD